MAPVRSSVFLLSFLEHKEEILSCFIMLDLNTFILAYFSWDYLIFDVSRYMLINDY